jgi:hypothetical protein
MSDPELMATERLKNLVRLTGDIEIDVIANMEALLKREILLDDKFKLGRSMDVYTTDTDKIPTFPAISIDLVNSETKQRTIGKDRATFERNVYIDIFYYHADVNNKNVESETRIALSRLNSILARNADLNGYCRRGMVDAKPSRILDRVFGDKVVKSAVISKIVSIIYRDRAAGPGARP